MLRHRRLTTPGLRREKATTEHSADTPDPDSHRLPVGGVSRYGAVVAALVEQLRDDDLDVYESRELLRVVFDHVRDGGIVIQHCGSLVLTWPDGGASRRIAAGHWG